MNRIFRATIGVLLSALCLAFEAHASNFSRLFAINDETQDHWTFASVEPAEGEVTALTAIKLNYPKDMRGSGLTEANCDLTLTSSNGTSHVLAFDENPGSTALVCNIPEGGITEPGTYTLTVPRDLLTSLNGEYDHNEAATFTWVIPGQSSALTVTDLSSSAAGGVVLTFSQPVMVSHSAFGVKCYAAFEDLDAEISSLNAAPSVNGSLVTLTQQYCTFVDGHRIHLELNPECFVAADGETFLSGQTTFDFVMGEGQQHDAIQITGLTPSNGTRTNLANVTAVFAPALTEIVSPTGITIANENGDALPLARVQALDEGGVCALNINIDTDHAEFVGGTTYKLRIAAGAIRCGEVTNEAEIVAGAWYIRPEVLTLVATPANNRIVETLDEILVVAQDEQLFDYIGKDASAITVTGLMDEQHIVYAHAAEVRIFGHGYRIIFDKPVTPEVISEAGAQSSSVKVVIPEGIFRQGESLNAATQLLYTISEHVEMGEVTYTYNPAVGEVPVLGNPSEVSDEGGSRTEYTITIAISGENVYAAINDASGMMIVDEETGEPVMTFEKYDVTKQGENVFSLQLSRQITEPSDYTLIIPSEAICLYTDVNHYSAVQHPETDVEATWTVKGTAGIAGVTTTARPETYTLAGVRVTRTADHGVYVKAGRKVVK